MCYNVILLISTDDNNNKTQYTGILETCEINILKPESGMAGKIAGLIIVYQKLLQS